MGVVYYCTGPTGASGNVFYSVGTLTLTYIYIYIFNQYCHLEQQQKLLHTETLNMFGLLNIDDKYVLLLNSQPSWVTGIRGLMRVQHR